MREITLTVGIPASGKTTWALQAGFDVMISLDDCRQELWGDYTRQSGPGEVATLLALQEQKICDAIADKKRIVVHNTHHLREFRKPIIDLARKQGYRVRILYFDIVPAICRQRNHKRTNPVPEAVMDEFISTMEIPTKDEADEVFNISEMTSPSS